jgi:dipeptidyl aminopeptidase/acylaminoacyl peptidase
MKKILWPVLLVLLLLAACSQAVPPAAQPTPVLVTSTSTPFVAAPTATGTPTPTPFTATATPTLHPMSILAMRARSYPGGEIVIESEFQRGANYRCYYVHYPSDGLKIYAMMTIPDGEPPEGGWPAIVFNHGYYPPELYRTDELYESYIRRLAQAGYVVFRSDYRGHDRSEGEALGAYGDPGYTVDILNAVASLQQYPSVNPEKIGMWGHSMGGFLTLRAMVISPEIKAGVIWAGVVVSYPEMLYSWRRNPMFAPSPDETNWRVGWIEQYGTPDENPEFWASVSANTYLADLSGPLQLHHGTGDEEVPLEFSIRLAEQVRQAGGTVELYTYEGDNHSIGNNFKYAMDRTVAFFDLYLK